MPARGRTPRDERRRRLGQNFLRADTAERLVDEAGVSAGELVVDVGAGGGAITDALLRRGAEVLACEPDPVWSRRLADRHRGSGRLTVVAGEFATLRLPARPFRVLASLPFGSTTEICRRLFDDPGLPLTRADLVVQWEVARKRAFEPPASLVSATWAPWWQFALGRRIPAAAFRPVPRVDGGVLVARRRSPPVLPEAMAPAYREFVASSWPFDRPAPPPSARSPRR